MIRTMLTGALALSIGMLALAPAAQARGGFTHVGPRGVTHAHWGGRGYGGWHHGGYWRGGRWYGAGAVAAGAAVGVAATREAYAPRACGPYPYYAGPYCYPY